MRYHNPLHWLLRPTVHSAGSSVSGAGSGAAQPAPRVLDPFYIRSHFDDAPDEALAAAKAAVEDIQRERASKFQ